jgi:Ca2+-binding RTX toxin-like protein
VDSIDAGDGDNLVIAGFGGDTVTTGTGSDTIIGDNGEVFTDTTGILTEIISISLDIGGDDFIYTGDGDNSIIAGFGGDTVTTGAGNDSVIADNGSMQFINGVRNSIQTNDDLGGNDFLYLGAGDDQAIGGSGMDTIETTDGINVILGDNGLIQSDSDGIYIFVTSGDPGIGGDDVITGGARHDIIIGGVGSDILYGGAGDDFLQGDGGTVTRDGRKLDFVSIDLFTGDVDTLDGGPGQDVLIAGYASDLLVGSLSEDVMVGEYARIVGTLNSEYNIVSIESANTLAQGKLDLIRMTALELYDTYEPVDREDAEGFFAWLTETTGGGVGTGIGTAYFDRNPLSNPAFVDGWRVIHDRYGDSGASENSESGSGIEFPFDVRIDPLSGNIIIIQEESQPEAEQPESEEPPEGASNIEDQETRGSDGRDNTVNDEGSDDANGQDDTGDEGSDTEEQENSGEDEDDSLEGSLDTEFMEYPALAAGWAAASLSGDRVRTTRRLDQSSVREIFVKRRFLRWQDLNP